MKRLYGDKLERLNYTESEFLKRVPRRTDFSGSAFALGIAYGGPSTASADASVAFSGSGTTSTKQFLVTAAKDYAAAYIDGLAAETGIGDGSIVDAMELAVDSALDRSKESLLQGLFGNGGGAIGQISTGSTVSGTTITLTNTEDVVNFEVGDILQGDTTDGTSGTVHTGTVTLTAVDRDTGVLTASGNWNSGIASIATSDYLFKKGNFGAKIKGIGAWVPSTAPDSTSFFGVDRSADPVRLGGIRISSTARIDEALNAAVARMVREQAKPTLVVMNPTNWMALSNVLGSTAVHNSPLKMGEVGFGKFVVNSPYGPLEVITDSHCPKNKVYLLDMKTWCLHTAGSAPKVLGRDAMWLRTASADGYECRIGYYGNLECSAPGRNGVLVLS